MQAADSIQPENRRREGRAQNIRHRNRHHENADKTATPRIWKPIGHVKQHARKETRFGDTENQAQGVVAQRSGHQRVACRNHAPDGEHQENPAAGAEFLKDQIAGDLKNQIAGKKYAGAKSVHGGRKTQILVHGQGGKADIHPVDIIDQIKQGDERHQPARASGENQVVRSINLLCHSGSCTDTPDQR